MRVSPFPENNTAAELKRLRIALRAALLENETLAANNAALTRRNAALLQQRDDYKLRYQAANALRHMKTHQPQMEGNL